MKVNFENNNIRDIQTGDVLILRNTITCSTAPMLFICNEDNEEAYLIEINSMDMVHSIHDSLNLNTYSNNKNLIQDYLEELNSELLEIIENDRIELIVKTKERIKNDNHTV